ncbi:MAG: MarR family transcriptional regulator [Candidatus Saccharibacteria bacterium]
MDPSNTLSYKLHAVVYSIDALSNRIFKDYSDINFPQFLIILCAYQNPGHTQKFSASWLQLTEATVSYMVKVVHKKGYIEVRLDEDDLRTRNIFVTDSGKELIERIYPMLEESLGGLFGDIDSKKMAEFVQGLDLVYKSLNNKMEEYECI